MPFLNNTQISELTDESLNGQWVLVIRGKSRNQFHLIHSHKHGMKGVVWRAKDDLGDDVALKIIPSQEYAAHSLIDEMTEAVKLESDYFATIKAFGDLEFENDQVTLSMNYKAIATKWISGDAIDEFMHGYLLTVDQFVALSEQLFRALAVLQNRSLCHDDLHPGNVLLETITDDLTNEPIQKIRIIDTGTIKRQSTRDYLLTKLREKVEDLEKNNVSSDDIESLKKFLAWKEPDDHLRVAESLLHMANALASNYSHLEFWERKFSDELDNFFQRLYDQDLERRLDSPDKVISELKALVRMSKIEDNGSEHILSSPFDYISAEMIRNDTEFAELFSKECPWLEDCQSLEPLYIYGPRGCGKSSVLRWLSFKTIVSDPTRGELGTLKDIGVYVSCSVELRSRFWLLEDDLINQLQNQIIRFFNLLLLEELFETLAMMMRMENSGIHDFGFNSSNISQFTAWVIERMTNHEYEHRLRLQGQTYFDYLEGFTRQFRWETWTSIKKAETEPGIPDPSLVSDICRALSAYFDYFKSRHITFLLDDYSNQRIPVSLQRKLNQTISFAKQGTPIFKVSSEYNGVDLEGIQEGREVVEINIGAKYTSLSDKEGQKFLSDIVNIRLDKAKYVSKIEDILGFASYTSMPRAIAEETEQGRKFYYHGIDYIHWLCSGDVALALDLIRKIFETSSVDRNTKKIVKPNVQHATIQQFSHDEIKRIRYIVPHGEQLHDIVCYLGIFARAVVMSKRSRRKDKEGEPICMTHMDVRVPAIKELKCLENELSEIFKLLTSRAILFTLETSRSRISGATERLQLRKIYLPAFKAPLKRDVPIKIDSLDELTSLLSNPKTFIERELGRADVHRDQFSLALEHSIIKPRGN